MVSTIKAFPADKNYMLGAAQKQMRSTFVFDAYTIMKEAYCVEQNPLGIIDSTVQKIMDYVPSLEDSHLNGFYENLCIAYRYLHGDNQLAFVWDGRTQEEHYADVWREAYKEWLKLFSRDTQFLKLYLVLTVFRYADKNYQILENRLKGAVNSKFDLKIRNQRLKVA